ncbi:DUF917 domain-containing protein (plasmid) [Rhizobium leguminosarum]
MAIITNEDIDDLAVGAALLGTGGGGDPYIGKLMAKAAIERHGPVDLLALYDVPDGIEVAACGAMGAPTILIEKMPSGEEIGLALRVYEKRVGKAMGAIIPFEAGGINSMVPIMLAAECRLPVIDADGMGRAFPQLEMETFNVYGVPAAPLTVADEQGNVVIIETESAAKAEWLARGVTIRMGGQSYLVNYGMDGRTTRRVSVPGTMSLAIGIGRTIRLALAAHRDPLADLIEFFAGTHYETARLLTSGKVVDVSRREQNGWSVGVVTIEPFDTSRRPVRIQIQNENLVAEEDGRVLAIVPDLICILEADTAEPITTERLRYGQRVNVLGVKVPPIMRTPEALDVFGPAAFGLTQNYAPLEAG